MSDHPRTITLPAVQLPVLETDVLVAGAGTAGCIAAIAAARQGASVILIEKLPVPGGTYTNGGIGANSFYAMSTDPSTAKRVVGGIPYELNQRLVDLCGGTGYYPTPNDPHHNPYRFVGDHEIYKGVISQMLLEAGITVYLQTTCYDVLTENGKITAALIANKDGCSAIAAKQYIDASGDGDLARFAGLEQIDMWQDYHTVSGGSTGLVFGMAGVDIDRMVKENPQGAVKLSSAELDVPGICAEQYAFTTMKDPERYQAINALEMRPFTSMSSIHKGEMTYINNSKGVDCDATKALDYSTAELKMRVKIMQFANALKTTVPGFEESYINWAAIQLGVRASKITICDHMISLDEITSATRFEDEIGLFGFEDLMSYKHPECEIKDPGFYGFPYRMLLPKGCDNLLMAGRCVTTDIKAHMSTRNVPGCQVMGQGAGVAAALCAKKDCTTRELSYPVLRDALLAQGVILE